MASRCICHQPGSSRRSLTREESKVETLVIAKDAMEVEIIDSDQAAAVAEIETKTIAESKVSSSRRRCVEWDEAQNE